MSVYYYGMAYWSNEDYDRGLDRVVSRVELLGYVVV
jgi:hypothetical protein